MTHTKPWQVFNKLTGYVGTVFAQRKYQAMFLAERELRQRPGSYYVAAE